MSRLGRFPSHLVPDPCSGGRSCSCLRRPGDSPGARLPPGAARAGLGAFPRGLAGGEATGPGCGSESECGAPWGSGFWSSCGTVCPTLGPPEPACSQPSGAPPRSLLFENVCRVLRCSPILSPSAPLSDASSLTPRGPRSAQPRREEWIWEEGKDGRKGDRFPLFSASGGWNRCKLHVFTSLQLSMQASKAGWMQGSVWLPHP